MNFMDDIKEQLLKKEFEYDAVDADRGKMDRNASAIIGALENSGYEAYAVGGCVRDLLLAKAPHDWDITTSAKPEEIISVMGRNGWKTVDGAGRRFGTVIVVINHIAYEVTTFRNEFYGQDSHRPENITFSSTLKEDLSRRDFTVNALALGRDGVVYDYFDGIKDLGNKKLRTVGKAEERFREDALRLFRACRFIGQLDFMADKSLVRGMASAFDRVSGLSLERVREEVEKLLVSPFVARGLDLLVRTGLNECSCRIRENGRTEAVKILPELSHLVDLPQQKKFHKFDGWYHTLAVVNAAPPTLLLRWAALLHDVGKGMPGVRRIKDGKYTDYGHDLKGAEMAAEIFRRWRFPAAFAKGVVWLVENHMRYHYFANVPEANVEKWLRQLARGKQFSSSADMKEGIGELTALCNADIIGCGKDENATEGHSSFGKYMEELCQMMPVSAKDLRYDRRVIDALRPAVADGMANLLFRVQNGTLKNEEEALLDAAVRYRRRHNEDE